MKGRVRWSHVTIALALIAALAIAAPAIGGPSLKKLVKKEVSKQIAKATGPAGPPGPQGQQGLQGEPGQDATNLFAYIRDADEFSDAVVEYGSGVVSVTEPLSTEGRYIITFNRDMQNCVVQALAGTGDPSDIASVNTSFPAVRMDVGTSAQVQLDWLRPDNDVDFGVAVDTSFLVSAFC